MNLLPWFVIWVAMAAVVLVLAAWRKTVTRSEDDSLHMTGGEGAIAQQVALTHKLAKIDRWGKGATIIAAVYGLALAAVYLYQIWTSTTTLQQ